MLIAWLQKTIFKQIKQSFIKGKLVSMCVKYLFKDFINTGSEEGNLIWTHLMLFRSNKNAKTHFSPFCLKSKKQQI